MGVINLKEDKPASAFKFCCFNWEASLNRTSPFLKSSRQFLSLVLASCFKRSSSGPEKLPSRTPYFPPDYGRIDFKQY